MATICSAEEVKLGIKAPRKTNLIIMIQRERKSKYKDRKSETQIIELKCICWLIRDVPNTNNFMITPPPIFF